MNLRKLKFNIVSFLISLSERPIITKFEFRTSSIRDPITVIGKICPLGFEQENRISKLNIEIPKMGFPLMPLNAVCINGNWFKPASLEDKTRFESDFRSIRLTDWKKI